MSFFDKNICVSLSGTTFNQCVEQLNDAAFFELRLDRIKFSKIEISEIIALGKEWIVSVRKDFFKENNFENLFKASLNGNIRFVDFDFSIIQLEETQRLLNLAKQAGIKILFSEHNFIETPDYKNICATVEKMISFGADAVKYVSLGNKQQDLKNIIKLFDYFENITAFCMGDKFRESRIVAMAYGLAFSYAYPDNGVPIASGQYSFSEMQSLALKWKQKEIKLILPYKENFNG